MQELRRTGGNRLHSWKAHTRFHMHWDPHKAGARAKLTCRSWRVSWGSRGQLWLTVGARTLVTEVPGNTDGCECSWRSPFWHQDLAPPNSLQLRCWDTSGQTTSRVGTQPHPSADRLPKLY